PLFPYTTLFRSMIRPDQFLLCEPEKAQMTGIVLRTIYCGHSTLLQVQTSPHCGDHEIQVRLNGAQSLQPGDLVHLCVRGEVMASPTHPYPLLFLSCCLKRSASLIAFAIAWRCVYAHYLAISIDKALFYLVRVLIITIGDQACTLLRTTPSVTPISITTLSLKII